MKHLTLAALLAMGLFASLNATASNLYGSSPYGSNEDPMVNQPYVVHDNTNGTNQVCRRIRSSVYCN